MARATALEYLVLRCADLERSRLFYGSLGLTLVAEQHDAGPLHFSCSLGDTVLELYPATAGASARVRLGLLVLDVAQCVANVQAVGADVVKLRIESRPRTALVRDPDGNDVALTESDVSS